MFSQSYFLPGNPCIVLLMSIAHEIQTSFDNNPATDLGGVFLDISRAFDNVLHSVFLFKLQAYYVDIEFPLQLKNYLENPEKGLL